MDLSKTLQDYEGSTRTCLVTVCFLKPVDDPYFPLRLSKLPKDVLIEWLSAFLKMLQKEGRAEAIRFTGNITLGSNRWPLQFKVCENQITVAFISTTSSHRPVTKVQDFLVINGTEDEIKECVQGIISSNQDFFRLYSPDEGVYNTK